MERCSCGEELVLKENEILLIKVLREYPFQTLTVKIKDNKIAFMEQAKVLDIIK